MSQVFTWMYGMGMCYQLIKSRGNGSWTRMLGDITVLKCFVLVTDKISLIKEVRLEAGVGRIPL